MAMTLTEIRSEVRENIKRNSSAFSDDRITRRVNWAQQLLADLHTYEEMKKNYTGATVDGQLRYGFPSRMKDIVSMTLQDGASSRKLTYVKEREFDSKVPRAEQTTEGRSSWYVDYGVNFELYRIPDAIYVLRLRCSIYPTDLSADSDESELLRKDALLCALTTVFGFQALKEVEDALYWSDSVVPSLYSASLSGDHSAEDWTPIARGFQSVAAPRGVGYSNPLIRSDL